MSRHADVGTHEPRHDAAWITGTYWGEHNAARRAARQTVWATDRPIPLGVTGDSWPLEVTA